MEACQRQQTGDKTIFITKRAQDGQLEFVVNNSFDGELKPIGGKYLSSKRNGFGLGVSSVLETVEWYNGIINLYADEKGFHAELSLPTRAEKRIPIPVYPKSITYFFAFIKVRLGSSRGLQIDPHPRPHKKSATQGRNCSAFSLPVERIFGSFNPWINTG